MKNLSWNDIGTEDVIADLTDDEIELVDGGILPGGCYGQLNFPIFRGKIVRREGKVMTAQKRVLATRMS